MELWHGLVLGYILIAYCIHRYLVKRVTQQSWDQKFFSKYFLCALMAVALTISLGQFTINWLTLSIFGLGFVNGWGAWCQWKSIAINQSRTAICSVFDDVIAMSLSYVFFNEAQYLSYIGVAGIVLVAYSAIMIGVDDYCRQEQTNQPKKLPLSFYGYVLFYSVVWGVANFLIKWYGLEKNVPEGTFLAHWYCGAFLAAAIIVLINSKKSGVGVKKELFACFKMENLWWGGLIALCIGTCLYIEYQLYQISPMIIVAPIFMGAEAVLPALIGLYIFREIKELELRDKILMAGALIGGIFIAVSY